MGNVTVNVSFQDSLLRDIDRVARDESRSRSELLREAARVYIQRKERLARIFAWGRELAARKALAPGDVAAEIAAHRRNKAPRK
ncbi:MAG TPA: ribbon-helix-helix protein, CopG family [Candidatus Brocadiia bacterium]|nr:ribbon-helix-helix protein, CopG family [Candidatus Brocadiia bacterium]